MTETTGGVSIYNGLDILFYHCKCNFAMSLFVCLLVRWSVCHAFLKRQASHTSILLSKLLLRFGEWLKKYKI